jgi:hypothetical protein
VGIRRGAGRSGMDNEGMVKSEGPAQSRVSLLNGL